jgi:methyltransferase (TIGR00027 family)
MNAEPSRTAEYMALFRALESAQPADRRLFEDPNAARFLRPALRLVAIAARRPALRAAIVAFIDRRWPGPRLSGVVRTRVIDDFVVSAIDGGCTQLVLLGAGYDTRATRLAQVSPAVVFEVDHPATQARKRAMSLRHDESTAEAAVRLGVTGAPSIPNFYRLATLQV